MATGSPFPAEIASDVILARFRAELEQMYGVRLQRVVLYGSRARGDAQPDSDYDIAVFLNASEGLWRESGRLAEIGTDILLDTGAVINALPFPAAAYAERTPLMHELRRDGRDL
jgi:predicted nucleotidyltransferase